MKSKKELTIIQRVQEIFVQDKPIDMKRIYHAVFITSQGVPEKYGHDRRNLNVHAIDALKQYLEKHSPINSNLKGNIIPI